MSLLKTFSLERMDLTICFWLIRPNLWTKWPRNSQNSLKLSQLVNLLKAEISISWQLVPQTQTKLKSQLSSWQVPPTPESLLLHQSTCTRLSNFCNKVWSIKMLILPNCWKITNSTSFQLWMLTVSLLLKRTGAKIKPLLQSERIETWLLRRTLRDLLSFRTSQLRLRALILTEISQSTSLSLQAILNTLRLMRILGWKRLKAQLMIRMFKSLKNPRMTLSLQRCQKWLLEIHAQCTSKVLNHFLSQKLKLTEISWQSIKTKLNSFWICIQMEMPLSGHSTVLKKTISRQELQVLWTYSKRSKKRPHSHMVNNSETLKRLWPRLSAEIKMTGPSQPLASQLSLQKSDT